MAEITRFNKGLTSSLEELERGKFAILVPVVKKNGKDFLLFETRALTLRRQPGEVCFPGGKIEQNELPEDCAVRECFEEVGLPGNIMKLKGSIGNMKSLLNELVNVFVAEIEAFDESMLKVNPAEVHEVFLVPVEFFREHCPASSFTYEGHYIWGLTARAVNKYIAVIQ